jgi:hypothetical protein
MARRHRSLYGPSLSNLTLARSHKAAVARGIASNSFDVRIAVGGKLFVHRPKHSRPRADIGTRSGISRCAFCSRSSVLTGIFERLRRSQFAEPIWQPVFFALLLLLISVTLVLIITT